MLAVLVAAGAFLYHRFEVELNRTVDQGLRGHAEDVARAFDARGASRRPGLLGERAQGFAAVLDRRGRSIAASPAAGGGVEPTAAQLRQASAESFSFEAPATAGGEGEVRVYAMPLPGPGAADVVLAGVSTADRDEALEDLLEQMLIVGPAALVLSSLAAFLVASAALRSVEAMRKRAALISAARLEERLPVPAGERELARLGSTLNAMLDRLAEAIERQREFVADAGHEMRTPLTNLRAELELAAKAGRSRAEVATALASATEETERLSQLAADLLLLAEAENGELPLDREAIPVAEVLASLGRRFGGRAAAQGRELVLHPAAGDVVAVDRMRIEQAIGNLLDNALRHGEGRIELGAEVTASGVRIGVVDAGPGFPPAFAPLAFERFSRGDPGRRGQGVGLGLSIVASIAAAHGGTVEIERGRGRGTAVAIVLPAA